MKKLLEKIFSPISKVLRGIDWSSGDTTALTQHQTIATYTAPLVTIIVAIKLMSDGSKHWALLVFGIYFIGSTAWEYINKWLYKTPISKFDIWYSSILAFYLTIILYVTYGLFSC